LKKIFFTVILFSVAIINVKAQSARLPDFKWSNCHYYDMEVGESIFFNDVKVTLLKIENHYNLVKIGDDTLELKVARRSPAVSIRGNRIFVADNKNVKGLSGNAFMHGLLTKDALICLCKAGVPMLDTDRYIFPVCFNDGFLWSSEEESYMFSFPGDGQNDVYPGIGIDLHDAKGVDKHWLTAIENSNVVWISGELSENDDNSVCVLLESESQSEIFYIYNKVYKRSLSVKKGRKLAKGDIIGTAWGDPLWGHLQFGIVRCDTIPLPSDVFSNLINGFPQLYELYFKDDFYHIRQYSKGRINFGKPDYQCGNRKNSQEFEVYEGKGWLTGKWNIADKVEFVTDGIDGNVRLRKKMFKGTGAECENPLNYFDYEISVPNGTYRIRAKAGDIFSDTWQKIEFEGVRPFTLSLKAGEFDWTTERIAEVNDRRLTIRIYLDEDNKTVAGLSEIVFQKAK
jgi:hypothetical protein